VLICAHSVIFSVQTDLWSASRGHRGSSCRTAASKSTIRVGSAATKASIVATAHHNTAAVDKIATAAICIATAGREVSTVASRVATAARKVSAAASEVPTATTEVSTAVSQVPTAATEVPAAASQTTGAPIDSGIAGTACWCQACRVTARCPIACAARR